jgi:hypothetical protein
MANILFDMRANFAASSTSLYQTPCIDYKEPLHDEQGLLASQEDPPKAEQGSLATDQQPLPSEQRWRHLLPSLPISRALFTARHPWPNPEMSIGVECSPLGKNNCWEAIGPARAISIDIYRETKEVLDEYSEFLAENELIPCSIMFGIYMVGRKESSANPTLIICSGPKKPRQKALDLIRSSGILRDYPGVLLAGASQSPICNDQVRLLEALGAANSNLVYFTPPRQYNVCGRPIHLLEQTGSKSEGVPFIAQKATIGGFVRLKNSENDDLYCGLTVAHAFMNGLESSWRSSHIDFEFDEYDDGDNSENEVPYEPTDGKPLHPSGI